LITKWAACLVFNIVLLAASLAAEPANSTANDHSIAAYHAGASEVRVTFFTTDENNHPVDAIDRNDFAIVDGDIVVREFRSLTRSDETALDVVVLVDASDSVANHFRLIMNEVLQLVFQKPATNDNISVVSFAGLQPVLICARNCGTLAAVDKLHGLTAGGATPLFDALAYSASFITSGHSPGMRPVVILISDGDDTISKTSLHDALQAVIDSGALLYTVDLNKPGNVSHGSAVLQRMAEATGGRYFSLREGAANVLQAALEDLRASYVVTYQLPSHRVGYHSLRILPKHNLNLRFHCRSGYYFGTNVP
jgi:VWFA-related protein